MRCRRGCYYFSFLTELLCEAYSRVDVFKNPTKLNSSFCRLPTKSFSRKPDFRPLRREERSFPGSLADRTSGNFGLRPLYFAVENVKKIVRVLPPTLCAVHHGFDLRR